MRNQIEFKVYGRYALFTDPITKVGGEKFTYQVPTYQALIGICESIYWKPTIQWKIDQLRVINPIRTQSQGIRPINYSGGNTLSIYTYLVDVEYEVRAHFKWNTNRPDLEDDRNEHKHFFVAKRMLERGGRRDIFLGTRECQAYVEPVKFGEKKGFYDQYGELQFDLMFFSFEYPSDSGKEELIAYFSKPLMKNGIIQFPSTTEDMQSKFIKRMKFNKIKTIGLEEKGLLQNYKEEV
ncbi:type I-C CRISPR-associated protein Cas5 [Alkaliphilus pronyensis]|uniref:pre-crRNA processing endonuclease n=1 Tax=Alkaliphilus pronyensis TaxID=1482732 RepID=A0A6I0F1C4_9FIRM|nr:type I-C CRISPR-associated protein Cas5c [Alkaliphilus pronyensis]KAB3529680.1 type I-C CRISPR-associated protein Cas5 [Alkaliphilus pronyensis]